MTADTKERILNVAERLFADRGFPATPLRDITNEAGVNIASVNYHFGSKEALLAAVLERRLRPVNARRLELLDAIEAAAGNGVPNVEDVIRAFLAPPFQKRQEWGAGGDNFLRLLGRIHSETNEEFRATFFQQFQGVFRRFEQALQRALPHLDATDIGWRMLFLVGSMALTMAWGESFASIGPASHKDPEDVLESLIQYAAAGMASPVPIGVPVGAAQTGHAS
ncbi:MAG: TetR/AcrR family transcriptional regulator [Acidobacteria bacterium]|nr:TetR/AcrR family transcriptional regulator [Acidobacteriota bacterium]